MKPKLQPIPKAAMPVVRIIRRDVPRPKMLPTDRWGTILRFPIKKFGYWCDPMGLHPKATNSWPAGAKEFPASNRAIRAFYMWWDYIPAALAQQAVDAVWGKRRKR